MHTSTFLQKASFNWLSWRITLPFLLLLTALGGSHSVNAQRFTTSTITIDASPTGKVPSSTRYLGKTTSTTGKFDGAVLGGAGNEFDLKTGNLKITASSATINSTGVPITQSVFHYRVYLQGTSPLPDFTQVPLVLTSTDNITTPVTYEVSGTSIDLLAVPQLIGGGTFVVDAYFDATYDDGAGDSDIFTDPGNGATNPYKATFRVTAPPATPAGAVTKWISQSSTDWFAPANWSNGVPNRLSDAIIPEKTPGGTTTITPLLASPNRSYEVRTLTLNGTTNSTRALLRIGQSIDNNGTTTPTGATLRVYGDLNTYSGGILASVSGTNGVANPATNSTIVLARNDGGTQVVRGLLEIVDIRIEGSGLKAVINSIAASNTFTFDTDPNGPGAIVQTSNDDATATSYPTLNTTKTTTVNLKDSGYLFGETANSYIRGVTIADRSLVANVKQTFGNIGIDVTPNRNIPQPNVNITRTVGDPLFGPLASNDGTAPAGSPKPIKRQYGISGDVNNNTTSTIVFHYLNSANELNDNPEANLTIFKTANNAPPYTLVGRTGVVDMVNHTVTREGYSGSLNTITLGDEFNPLEIAPLPVVLTAFNATRNDQNTQVTWSTASEKNSAGFEVQVSTDGAYFRKIAFVSSQHGDATKAQNYSYLDTEANKSGVRYYRLRQVDNDGKQEFSPVRAVSFSGVAEGLATALLAYPNPYGTSDAVKLAIQTTSVGSARLLVSDLMGREVANQTFTTVNGVTEVSLDKAASLSAGSYFAQVTLASGEVKTVRIQKH